MLIAEIIDWSVALVPVLMMLALFIWLDVFKLMTVWETLGLMALGAVAAIDAAGKTGDIVVAGFDGSPDAVEAIKQGTLLATGLQPAVQIAEMAVEQADKMIKNGETGQPEKQSIDCELVTPENADDYGVFAKKT